MPKIFNNKFISRFASLNPSREQGDSNLFTNWTGANDSTSDLGIAANNGANDIIAAKVDSTRFLLAYRNASNYPAVVLVTVSSAYSVSVGTPSTAVSSAHEVFDLIVLSTSKAILVCNGRMFVVNLGSGNTISSIGSAVTGTGFDLADSGRGCRLSDSTFLYASTDSANDLRVGLYTVSGDSITSTSYDSSTSYTAARSAVVIMDKNSATDGNVIFQNDSGSGYRIFGVPLSVSGSTLTVDEANAKTLFQAGGYGGITSSTITSKPGVQQGFLHNDSLCYGAMVTLDGTNFPFFGMADVSSLLPKGALHCSGRTAVSSGAVALVNSQEMTGCSINDNCLLFAFTNDADKWQYALNQNGYIEGYVAALPSGNIETLHAVTLRPDCAVIIASRASGANTLVRIVRP